MAEFQVLVVARENRVIDRALLQMPLYRNAIWGSGEFAQHCEQPKEAPKSGAVNGKTLAQQAIRASAQCLGTLWRLFFQVGIQNKGN